MKLAVRAPEESDLPWRVAHFVHDLLHDADATRWLSLSSHLSTLAEAAPEEFLGAVESSLRQEEPPIVQLLQETSADPLFGRCWHADLLWALEMLAWSKDYILRAARILVRLAEVPTGSKWGNNPLESLKDIFLPWKLHTTATIEERLDVIDDLYDQSPNIVFNLCVDLLEAEITSGTHKPEWRDWDKAAARDVTISDVRRTRYSLLQKTLQWSSDNPDRLARLVDGYASYLPEDQEKLVAHIEALTPSDTFDPGFESIKTHLRQVIHFAYNHSDDDSRLQRAEILSSLLNQLQSQNPVVRHHWLFVDSWVELPEFYDLDDQGEKITAFRKAALLEIYQTQGWSGIEELVNALGSAAHNAGWAFGTLDLSFDIVVPHILHAAESLGGDEAWTQFVTGFLGSPGTVKQGMLQQTVEEGVKADWTPERIARLLSAGNMERLTWDLAKDLGRSVDEAYWRICETHYARLEEEDLNYALQRLLEVERPRSAFQLCRLQVKDALPGLLFEMLEGIAAGQEEDGIQIDGYHIAEMIRRLEQSEEIDQWKLLRMEFFYFKAIERYKKDVTFIERTVSSDPKVFVTCIGYLYKPSSSIENDPFAERSEVAAHSALNLLGALRILPGVQEVGSIDPVIFKEFYEAATSLADEVGRRDVCETQLGEWFAHAPADPDGKWPCAPVREVLNREDAMNVRDGFYVGVRNSRGTTSRGLTEGGEQERKLAAQYRSYADALSIRDTYVKQVLVSIAESYEHDASHEDVDARLWEERT